MKLIHKYLIKYDLKCLLQVPPFFFFDFIIIIIIIIIIFYDSSLKIYSLKVKILLLALRFQSIYLLSKMSSQPKGMKVILIITRY